MSIASKVIGLLGGVFNMFSLGGTSGGIIVRQKGGAAGSKELRVYHDGTNSTYTSQSGGHSFTNPVLHADGSNSAVGVGFLAEANTGFYRPSSGVVAYSSLGTISLRMGGSFRLASNSNVQWTDNTDATAGNVDIAIVRAAQGVLKITDAASGVGWLQNTASRVALTADVTNDSATLATTGLTVTLKAGRKYSFLAYLYVTTGAVLEGVKAAMAGTATITNLLADVEIKSHASTPIFTMGRVTAFDSAIGQTVADAGNVQVELSGTIECNAAGTLRIDFAKNADTGALLTTVKRGSWLLVEDMP